MAFDPSLVPVAKKLNLTAASTPILVDQVNFPLTVILDGVDPLHAAIFTELGTNSKKLSIQSGATQLPVEIEYWDSVAEKAVIHTKVQTYTATTDTELVLSYDSSQVDNTDFVGDTGSITAQNVWDSNFAAVYHMAQDPSIGGACILDSTGNANHGTPYGSMTNTDLVDDSYGKALDFDGVNDYINCGTNNSLNPGGSSFTIESLINTSGKVVYGDYRDNMSVVSKGTTGVNPLYNLVIAEENGYLAFNVEGTGDQFDLNGSVNVKTSTYHWVSSVVNRGTSQFALYVDGVVDNTASFGAVGDINPIQPASIGKYSDSPFEYFYKGLIAEVRISNVARSADWIKLTHLSLTNQLITYSSHLSGTPVSTSYDSKVPVSRLINASIQVFDNGKPWKHQYNLNTVDNGDITGWASGTSLPAKIGYSQAIATKNRVYLLGGQNDLTATSAVYTAPINEDGTLGTWATGTSLPASVRQAQAVVTKNRVYLLGGVGSSVAYTAPINEDGTLGSWATGPSLPGEMSAAQAVVTKNRVYLLGGYGSTAVYTAPINEDGTLGTWATGTSLSVSPGYPQAIVTKNRVYLVGGHFADTVYTAPINEDGTLGSWTPGTSLPANLGYSQAITTKNRVYILGGYSGAARRTVYTAPINEDGTLGSWTPGTSLSSELYSSQAIVTTSRVYLLGGYRVNTVLTAPFSGGLNDYSDKSYDLSIVYDENYTYDTEASTSLVTISRTEHDSEVSVMNQLTSTHDSKVPVSNIIPLVATDSTTAISNQYANLVDSNTAISNAIQTLADTKSVIQNAVQTLADSSTAISMGVLLPGDTSVLVSELAGLSINVDTKTTIFSSILSSVDTALSASNEYGIQQYDTHIPISISREKIADSFAEVKRQLSYPYDTKTTALIADQFFVTFDTVVKVSNESVVSFIDTKSKVSVNLTKEYDTKAAVRAMVVEIITDCAASISNLVSSTYDTRASVSVPGGSTGLTQENIDAIADAIMSRIETSGLTVAQIAQAVWSYRRDV